MHSNPKIVSKLAKVLDGKKGVEQRTMFGGACFMLNGNICVGVYHDWLIARVGEKAAKEALKDGRTTLADFTGRPMKGWLQVSLEGDRGDRMLKKSVEASLAYVGTLPKK
ncbi:MAG TPA: TfoX/Sxy family protein [Fimbriimonadaceae bacterium]|nr:TfoX/Sxy family protein [Fimbriimonadaceae bacterium]